MARTDIPGESTVRSLGDQLTGELLQPGEPGYEEARTVWNGMVEKHPGLVARCGSRADVQAAVDFADEHDLLVAVQGGGHSVAGKSVCDGGLLIDLSPMDDVSVDPATRTAHVGPGATWADVDAATQEHGLATTGGVNSETGVAGLTLGGGIGHLARSFGLACDNLRSVELITADGEFVIASEDEHPELFWGLRGGGGNFGVVTEFEFDLHEIGPEVLTAQAFHPIDDAGSALEFYREFMADAPDEVACYALIVPVPPEEPFPEAYHGEETLALVGTYSGAPAEGEPLLAPIADHGDPIVAFVDTIPYTALQQMFDEGDPEGERYYWKSHYVDEITDGLIETLLEQTDPLPGPFTAVFFEPMGGAINAVDATDTAYPHRDAAYSLGIAAGWSDSDRDEELIGWARGIYDAMATHCTGGAYANYLDHDDDDRVDAAFRENYDRLVELKTEWDSDNRFRLNQNVEPAG